MGAGQLRQACLPAGCNAHDPIVWASVLAVPHRKRSAHLQLYVEARASTVVGCE